MKVKLKMTNNILSLGFKEFQANEPRQFEEFIADLGISTVEFDHKNVENFEDFFAKIPPPSGQGVGFASTQNQEEFADLYAKFLEEILFDYPKETYQDNDFAKEVEILFKYVSHQQKPKHNETAMKYINSSLKYLRSENELDNAKMKHSIIDFLLLAPFLNLILWRELHTFGLIELEYDKENDCIFYNDIDLYREYGFTVDAHYLATTSLRALNHNVVPSGSYGYHFDVPIEIDTKLSFKYDLKEVVESIVDFENEMKDEYEENFEQSKLLRLTYLYLANPSEITFKAHADLKELVDELFINQDYRVEDWEEYKVYFDKFTYFGVANKLDSSSKHLTYSLLSDEKKEYFYDLIAGCPNVAGIDKIAESLLKLICLHPRTPSKIINKAKNLIFTTVKKVINSHSTQLDFYGNSAVKNNIKMEFLVGFALSFLIYEQVDKAIVQIKTFSTEQNLKYRENLAFIFLLFSFTDGFKLNRKQIDFFKSEISSIGINQDFPDLQENEDQSEDAETNFWGAGVSKDDFFDIGCEIFKYSREKAIDFLDYSNYSPSFSPNLTPVNVAHFISELARNESNQSDSIELYQLAKQFYSKEIDRERINGVSPLPQKSDAYFNIGLLEELVFDNLDSALSHYLWGIEQKDEYENGHPGCNSGIISVYRKQKKYKQIINFFESLEPIRENFYLFNDAILAVSHAYNEIGEMNKSDNLLDLIYKLDEFALHYISTITWSRFLRDQCNDNSKSKNLVEQFGPIDHTEFTNAVSNINLLELARTKNYQQALDAWTQMGSSNCEIKLYIAASLFETGRKEEALKITGSFSPLDREEMLEIVNTFASGKGFSTIWAQSCRTVLASNELS